MKMICKRCHRTLKDPESIRSGYGPVCYEREFGVPLRRKKTASQDVKVKEAPAADAIPGQLTIEDVFPSALVCCDEQDTVKKLQSDSTSNKMDSAHMCA